MQMFLQTPFASNPPIIMNNLQSPDSYNRIPNRPLGPLSTYAALDLGDDLVAVSSQKLTPASFSEKVRSLSVQAQEPLHELKSKAELAVAHLDIMMMPQGLHALGREIPMEVYALRDGLLAKDSNAVPMLTYEDIVLQNPQDDPRVFSRGDIGRSEIFFYNIHRHIEEEMTRIRERLFPTLIGQTKLSLMVSAVTKDFSQKEFLLHEVDDSCTDIYPHLSNVKDSMQQLFDALDPAHFTSFRPYFNPRLDAQYGRMPGPSGNYSGGMYCFDGLCIGRQPLMQKLNESKDAEISFFPRTETTPLRYETQAQMSDVKGYQFANGFTLEDCAVDYVRENVIRIFQCMKEIRDVHLQIFSKFIGSGMGTAMKTPDYLTLASRAYEQAIFQLK